MSQMYLWVMSALLNLASGLRFSSLPLDKLSMIVTSSPPWIKASTKFEPTNPRPPVTRILDTFELPLVYIKLMDLVKVKLSLMVIVSEKVTSLSLERVKDCLKNLEIVTNLVKLKRLEKN